MSSSPSLALFDFDGTLTDRDSLADFLYFTFRPWRFLVGMLILSPSLVLYVLKLLPNDLTKERVLTHFINAWTKEKLRGAAAEYDRVRLPSLFRPQALAKLHWHKAQGHEVAIVTASIEDYLEFWCQKEEVKLIGSKLAEENGRLTGKLALPNCYGEEKVRRIKEVYDLKQFSEVYAYGDSRADFALKEIAQHFYYRSF